MKRIILHLLTLGIIISCGEANTKKQENKSPEIAQKESDGNTATSSDYSSLLQEYSCDMDIAETAKALGVAVSDLSIPDYAMEPNFAKTGDCYFTITGYGRNPLGNETDISWGSEDGMSTADVKREIESYLKNQKEMPASVQKMTGMRIELAETGDAYLAFQEKHGRMLILNEHYGAMVFNYGTMNAATDRTQKQHEELIGKMVQLANYLLKKHRK